MAKTSTADLLEAFKEMTLLELSEFIKQFEETFDVKAAAGAPMMMQAPAGGGGGGEAAEEQSEFDVILTGAGDQKIQVRARADCRALWPMPGRDPERSVGSSRIRGAKDLGLALESHTS